MKKLFLYECRKIWQSKWQWLLASIALAIVLWLIVTGGTPISEKMNGMRSHLNEMTRPYWGQVMTEELRETFRRNAVALGAEEREEYGTVMLNPDASLKKYGEDSIEFKECLRWCALFGQPTLEEEKENHESALRETEEMKQRGEIGEAYYRQLTRAKNPAKWVVTPTSAWKVWLDPVGYGSMVTGVCLLGLFLILFSGSFSMEENGGLNQIVLSTPGRNKWIRAKILAVAVSGAAAAFLFSLAMLLVYGIFYGFHGWNLCPLAYHNGGYCYGFMYRDVTTLELALLRLFVLSLCGANLALVVAACSAWIRREAAAAGAAAVIFIGMESLLYISYNIRWQPEMIWTQRQWDWEMIDTILLSPVRMFLNPELFISYQTTALESGFQNLMLHNALITPDLMLAYAGTIIFGILLCAALCYGYQRQR